MTRPDGKAPRLLGRFAQGAIAAVAIADVFRAVAIRAHHVHPTDASLRESGFASMIVVYLMTLASVLFLVWLSRCRRNAEVLSPGTAAVSGAWAVVAWLIPVVNWWFPRHLVLDIERASASTSEKGRNTVLVNTWWVVWVAHSAVIAVELLVSQGAATPFIVVTEGLNIAAAVLAICVIEHITALQGAAFRAMSPVEPLAHA